MTFGIRLMESRLGLGMSQIDIAAAGGVLKNAQSNYEKDKRLPDVQYLTKVSKLGIDINYLIIGTSTNENELRLLAVLLQFSGEQQIMLEQFLDLLCKE